MLRVERTLYVGRSGRTNDAGIEALRRLLEPLGYLVRAVTIEGCLHLKTACTHVGGGVVLVNPEWVDASVFEWDGLQALPVGPSEPWAANAVRVGATVLLPAGNPLTEERLRRSSLKVVEVASGEFQKAEAGLSCLGVVIPPA